MKHILVMICSDCPYNYYNSYDGSYACMKRNHKIVNRKIVEKTTPDWCPLQDYKGETNG